MRDTLGQALDAVFGAGTGAAVDQEPGAEPGAEPGEPSAEVPEEVAALVEAAEQALADADEALRNGDLAGYAEKVDEAQDLITRAVALVSASTEG
jgi:uncharacterized membrane protein (UPF0182 family)